MKKLLPLLIFGLILNAGCDSNRTASLPTAVNVREVGRDTLLTLQFDTPKTFAEVDAITQRHNFSIVELRMEYPELTCGYVVAGRRLSTVRDDFLREHRKFLDAMATDKEHMDDALRARVQALRSGGDAAVSKIPVVVIETHTIPDAIPGVVYRRDSEIPQPSSTRSGMAKPPAQPSSSYHESWAPYAGTSEINQSFSRQWFVFNNTGSFGFAKGYEHEVLITNKSYVDESGYWSTNMPYSYNDCGNGGDSVDNFAIGCKIGWGMSNYTWYYAYHGFKANMSTTTSAKVQGARTKPGFPTCWSCWCFSSDAHTASPYIRFTSLPAGASWSY